MAAPAEVAEPPSPSEVVPQIEVAFGTLLFSPGTCFVDPDYGICFSNDLGFVSGSGCESDLSNVVDDS
jgi:hypothetical protein